jgi:hypothetical protein
MDSHEDFQDLIDTPRAKPLSNERLFSTKNFHFRKNYLRCVGAQYQPSQQPQGTFGDFLGM